MQFIFIKYEQRATVDGTSIVFDDTIPFVRDDAIDARVIEHEFRMEASFQFNPDKVIQRGMLIIFTDSKPDGTPYLRAFEIRHVRTSRIGQVQIVDGEDLGLADLTDSILPEFTMSGAAWDYAASEAVFASLWTAGELDPTITIPPASITSAWYKVATGSTSKLALRSSPNSSAQVIAWYANGTKVKEISNYNSTWKKVEVGGNVGYMARAYLTFYKNITTPGTPTITMNEKRKTRYALLTTILEKVGLKPVFRVGIEYGALARYVDYTAITKVVYNGNRIEIDQNVYSDALDYDDHNLYTRVYPIGKDGLTISSVTWDTASGDPGESPYGYEWVEDTNATLLYGRKGWPRTIEKIFDDIDNATDLINAGWEWLQTVNRPQFTLTVSTHDVGRTYEMGELVNVILLPVEAPIQANVIELTKDLLNPENSQITIGTSGTDVIANITKNTTDIAEIKDKVTTNIGGTILDVVYPIGSIYMSVHNTNPGNVIGGTWAAMAGRFLVGAGSTYPAGDTGGASEHKHLGTSGFSSDKQGAVWGSNGYASDVTVSGYRTNTFQHSGGSTGGITVPYTGDGSSLPPYLAVYMWKRTA